jgi:RHS repeat-associated protein
MIVLKIRLILRRVIILFAIAFSVVTTGYAQIVTDYKAYEDNTTVRTANVTTGDQVLALTNGQKSTTRTYLDGLGRTVQTVAIQASPIGKDLIQPAAFDATGNQPSEYLSYPGTDGTGSFRTASNSDLLSFYSNGTSTKTASDGSPFSQRVFESSPLHRLLKEGAVGDGFQPSQHYTSASYRPNTSADNVILWEVDGSYNNSYSANTLSVSDLTDADGVETLIFKDINGHTVLKRQLANQTVNGIAETYFDTYYIYNNAGLISYIVPPKAVALMNYTTHSYLLSQAGVNKLIFTFVYDAMGRLIEKTIPGSAVLYMVYDPLNRPVLMQDGNLRKTNQWNYIKYDAGGRAVSQGIYTDATNTSRVLMQQYVSGLTGYSTTWFESRSGTVINSGYYTNNVFPTNNISPLAYAYFDDYDLNQDASYIADYNYTPQSLGNEATPTTYSKGLPTIICKRSVGSGLSNIWLTSVIFYDKHGNVIQVQSNNQLNYTSITAVTDSKTYVPDFSGKTLQSKVIKITATGTAGTNTILTTFTYDADNIRVAAIDQKYNAQSVIHIASYAYNELGQLVKKSLGSNPNPLQSVDYRYNIRGQLLSINNSTLTNDSGTINSNGETNDLFGMNLLYDKVDANVGNTASYSGRITGIKWTAKNNSNVNTNERSYKYTYDPLNRLTQSVYAERLSGNTGSFSLNADGFDESGITYDENGNLITLKRNSSTIGGSSNNQVDNLTYTYSAANPNQLQSVTDGSGANYTGYGFRNLTGSTTGYGYDVSGNGNLTNDYYKGLTIAYNVLNRTDKITVTTSTNRYIYYTYDAVGKLLRKQQYDNGTLGTTTDYIDGYVYVNNTLSYFSMPEGRVVYVSATQLKPEYIINDQQGNARFGFQDNGSNTVQIVQENSYYAFGLNMAASTVTIPTVPNRRLYNGGSEWQNDYANLPDYYQTGYRNYDAALSRFVAVDPNAETAESLTSYQYAGNNPVMNNDPMGNTINQNPNGPFIVPQPPLPDPDGPSNDPSSLSDDDLLAAAQAGDPAALEAYGKRFGTTIYQAGNSESIYSQLGSYHGYDINFASNGSFINATYVEGNQGAISATQNGNAIGEVSLLTLLYLNNMLDQAEQGGEIPEGYSHAFDATALATDFHSITTTPITTFIKDAGESFVKYNRIVGGVGAVASLATVGVHLYNHQATWKDGVSGTLGVANLVLIAIPGIGEAAIGLELGVAAITLGWDAWNAYEEAHGKEK